MVINGKFHPEKHYGKLFFLQKKKISSDIPNGRFPILRPNLRTLSGIENFFSQNLTYWYTSLGWNSPGITMSLELYIIISRSRWKVEKTMKNSVFSNFDCDPGIMLKWL